MLRLIASLSFLWLVIVSTMAQSPPVLDADGQPLQSGVEYYVLPSATDIAGGLTLVGRNGSCPYIVGQEPLTTVVPQGLPVIFTPRVAGQTNIMESSDFTGSFSAASTCVQSTTWGIGEEVPDESTRRFIVTGDLPDYFKIVKNELNLYTLGWCPDCLGPHCVKRRCGSTGILVENGTRFLVLYDQAFPFMFRKVSSYYSI